MIFKVEKESELYPKVEKLIKECISVQTEAFTLARELAGDETSIVPLSRVTVLAGGMQGIMFKDNPGKDWCLLNKSRWDNVYRPNLRTKKGKEIQARINELPAIHGFALNELLELDALDLWASAGFWINKDNGEILIYPPQNITYDKWTPPKGLTEITEAEALEIKSKDKKEVV